MVEILVQRSLKYSMQRLLRGLRWLDVPLKKDQLYFAYGANLSEARLRSKYLNVEKVGLAFIKDHEIRFNIPCEYVGQGYAGLGFEVGKTAPGILFRTDRVSLLLLDVMEWVPSNFYRRRKVNVLAGGNVVLAWVYEPCHLRDSLRPSAGYLSFVRKSAEENAFRVESFDRAVAGEFLELDHSFNLWNPGRERLLLGRLPRLAVVHDRLREKLANWLP